MQIKADFTREELMQHPDVLFEACHPLEKLNSIASLLLAYPDGPAVMDKRTVDGVSNMIEDAASEIEYLIRIANEKWLRNLEKLKAANIMQA
ncbi:hypothetical protein [uncultured Desulfobacter sp.]|uniref:hypothetical protein n=1 Tax=uncultured Desulfobacter sp. TaxID=240139 RepID=UPI002AAC3B1F|nr:hypothetical protein [uncultured Desulfobacter sp.]